MGPHCTSVRRAEYIPLQEYFLGEDEEDIGLVVKGGLYEADLKQRRLKASYWPEPSHRILRGTWFVEKSPDWVPLKVFTLAKTVPIAPMKNTL